MPAPPSIIDLDALGAAALSTSPYDHVIVPDFLRREAIEAIHRDYPRVDRPGSVPVGVFAHGPAFQALLDALRGPALREAIERKFNLDLARRPTMITVRGQCRRSDGKIHTDSDSKIITLLIYMNPPWENGGGRLRLLRSPRLDDYAAEVPPDQGTLLAFRRCDHSWHGHEPFEGQRRAIQLNWVKHGVYVWHEQVRHRISSAVKALKRAG